MKQYDAIIIGFGKGGKTLAAVLGNAGKKTALIEKSADMYGGTCINAGCIPTKFLVHKAKEAMKLNSFEEQAQLYAQVMEDKNTLISSLRSKNLMKLENAPNVTVITGTAQLASAHEVEITSQNNTEILRGDTIFLNTGSVPVIPEIEGLEGNPHVITSEGLLALKTLPRKLIIIGGGYIGVEFASIYANFGSQVTLIQNGSRFLPREDADIAEAVKSNLQSREVQILTNAETKSIITKNGHTIVTVQKNGETMQLEADKILIATGRRPNTAGLGLEKAGVQLTARGGIVTDSQLRTTVPNIYAMGDVVGGLQFTYISLDDCRIVRSAILGDGSYTTEHREAVPYSVFLDPPFSRVGMSEDEARSKGDAIKVAKLPAAAIPKALVLEQPEGLLKAIVDEHTGLVLGAHLFCAESHEMINLIKLAMNAKLPYHTLRDMVFTHPTMSEALNDLFNI